MRAIERALREHAESQRPFVEVLGSDGTPQRVIGYREVTRGAQALVELLARERPLVGTGGDDASGGRSLRVGVVCGNTPAFVIADLALIAARAVEVPVPLAFSAEQAASLLEGVDVCLLDAEGQRRMASWGQERVLRPGCSLLPVDEEELLVGDRPLRLPDPEGTTADWECKVIHTSGTTSRPKGVRIRAHALDALLESLRTVMPRGAFTRYLSVVPFSLLIEQVTGLYMVLLDGGTLVQMPPRAALVGTAASAAGDAMPFVAAARPTALVATPALVDAFAAAADRTADAGRPVPKALFGTAEPPLICCGGAPVHPDLLGRLERHGLPVHEGYGLSENSSVVSWNTPGARRNGTVGRPLPHVRVRLADDGELLVKSTSLFAGYTRDDPSSLMLDAEGWLRTGDLAQIDADGFISITGRKKNVIITAGGRNVAPEWVEAQYAQLPFVRAVAVVGDGMAALHGLFVVDDGTDPAVAQEAVRGFGDRHLSDVERIAVPHIVTFDEQTYRRYFTVTGRPVRAAIAEALTTGTLHAAARPGRTPEQAAKENTVTPSVDIRPYGEGTGKLVLPAGAGHLSDLDPAQVIELLSEAGFLLLRGFGLGLEDFTSFVKAHSDRITLDPARSFHGGGVAQKVDAGTDAVGLHLENGNSPFGPDLTWFLCEKAARRGSQTTVCDGYRVWDRMGERARELFAAQDIVYSRNVEEAKWKAFVFHQLEGRKGLDEITFDDILALVRGQESTVISLNDDGSIAYSYRTAAAHPTLFGDRLAWANSIFGPSYNYEAPRITFADGGELPGRLQDELRTLTEQVTEDLQWQDGDVALIDNTRVMHGRREILDTDRTIYNAQSYLNRGLLPGRA
ncbi:AMP-binding protein [Streptomyces afghaniensis]|uniref:AMP-binding protein n=1 Tax=Streptomyces afghaniensis TaxID=66865 RepID=UPI002785C6DE|nr:AMP-binding protein [Streptomyces afghaniensis]MDQ1019016.1 long-subunit acyl-CoA synthetase (AMP-forming)/alpha-ketoglutarate-dependent taurine dioxygenase [Streptomyces afghaniensis]